MIGSDHDTISLAPDPKAYKMAHVSQNLSWSLQVAGDFRDGTAYGAWVCDAPRRGCSWRCSTASFRFASRQLDLRDPEPEISDMSDVSCHSGTFCSTSLCEDLEDLRGLLKTGTEMAGSGALILGTCDAPHWG